MRIICLEGCSGTGKTTQYKILRDYYTLNSVNCLFAVEKNYEPFRTTVARWHETKGPGVEFTEDDIRMFAKARANTFLDNFQSLEGKIDLLVLDRYFYTSAVYQRGSQLSPQDILRINIDYGSPVPDKTFLFDGNPKICFERSEERNKLTGGRHLFSVNPEKIAELKAQYLLLAKLRKEMLIVDSDRDIPYVTSFLISKIDSLL